jgi:hypothetical protein
VASRRRRMRASPRRPVLGHGFAGMSGRGAVSPRLARSAATMPRTLAARYDRLQCERFMPTPPKRHAPRIHIPGSESGSGAQRYGFNRAICEPTFVPKVAQCWPGCLLKATSQCLPPVSTRHASMDWVRAVHIHRLAKFFLHTQRPASLPAASPRP